LKTWALLFVLSYLSILIALPQHSVSAACYDVKIKAQIPCPNNGQSKSDYSQKTKVPNPPTKTPTPMPTDTPVSGAVQPVPQCTSNLIPGPITQPPSPTPSLWSTYSPWILGGGGLLLGLLIGLITRSKIYEQVVDDYQYPELHSHDHNEAEEEITVRSEKHDIQ
jgi:hypothetical protein